MPSGRRSQRLIEQETHQNYSELEFNEEYNDELDADAEGETNEEETDLESQHDQLELESKPNQQREQDQGSSSFTTSNIDPQLFNQTTVDHSTSTSNSIKDAGTDDLSLIKVAFNEFSKTLLQFSLGRNQKYPTLIDH